MLSEKSRYSKSVILEMQVAITQIILIFAITSNLIILALQVAEPQYIPFGSPPMRALMAGGFAILLVLVTRGIYVEVVINAVVLALAAMCFIVPYTYPVMLLVLILTASITAGLVADWRVMIVAYGLLIVRLALHILNMTAAVPEDTVVLGILGGVAGAVPLMMGGILRFFVTRLQNSALKAESSANLLRASATIGQIVSTRTDLKRILMDAVQTIREHFKFYHVQIFLVDEDARYAHLTAATGEIGRQMIARQHRLTVDTESITGRAALTAAVIVERDVRRARGFTYNELLPNTRSEMAIPIQGDDRVIGVLDIQSDEPNGFSSDQIETLELMATQLGTAIRNAQLFEIQERNLRENKRLFIESETNLREIQRLNRQLTRQAWEDYLRADRRISGVTLTGQDFSNRAEWTPRMAEAGQRRRPIMEEVDGKRMVAIPVELRGEVIGAIEMEFDGSQDNEEVLEMAQAIAQRFAVSLDNARLFEETHEATAQEQRVTEIVSQYQSADSVDELLKITLQGLAETLGAEEGSIRLGTIPDTRPGDFASKPNGKSPNGGSVS